MANYRDLSISDAPFKAGVDLTGKQYYWVAPGSIAGEVIVAVGPSGNPWPIGILQNAPSSGQEAQVRVLGFSKAVVEANACSLRWGAWLNCASDGQTEPHATEGTLAHNGSPTVARYMDTGTISSGCAIAQVYIQQKIESVCGYMTAS
mgnify:CR=1 FL=1